jgi:hypothetical protein
VAHLVYGVTTELTLNLIESLGRRLAERRAAS